MLLRRRFALFRRFAARCRKDVIDLSGRSLMIAVADSGVFPYTRPCTEANEQW
jgi:hypothetical protein